MKEFWNTIQLIFTATGGWLGWFLGGCDGLLRIFGGSADRLRGSRKIDFFSSHHFKVLLFVSPRASARYGNRAKITIFGNYSSL